MSSCVEAEARFFVQCAARSCECATGEASGSFNLAACEVDDAGVQLGECLYSASFVLASGMTSSLDTDANNNKIETSQITVYAFDLSIDSNGSVDIPDVEGATIIATLAPEGFTCISMSLLPESIVGAVGTGEVVETVVAVKFYGRTTGGLEVDTPEQYLSLTLYNDPDDCTCDDDSESEAPPGSDGTKIRCRVC